MNWLSTLITAAVKIAGKLIPPAAKIDIAGTSVTARQLETASQSLAAFFTVLQAALAAKSFGAEAEVTIDEALALAADVGLGEPVTGIASALLPFVFGELAKLAAAPLIPIDGGRGGLVTKPWADDPRHRLNPDGSFKH